MSELETVNAAGAAEAGPAPAATRIKLCGMSRDEDIDAVIAAAPDMVGFIVDFPRSHRSVTPERAVELACRLEGTGIARVAVFVDADPEDVVNIALAADFEYVQLHGHEDAAYVEDLRGQLGADGGHAKVIQAFRVTSAADVAAAEKSPADLVLLDAGQGSGEAFDWSLSAGAARPFLLAGGLTPDNVAAAVAAVHPWGVDMSSGIETNKVKDAEKMARAVAAIRKIGVTA